MHRNSDYEDKKLYISQLPLTVNEKDLRQLFDKYGKVVQCFIVKKDGKSKGNAFVEFENKKECEEALKAMNNFKYYGKNIIVQKAKSLPPEERERKKYSQTNKSDMLPPSHISSQSSRIDRERFRDNRIDRNIPHQFITKEADRLIDMSIFNDLKKNNIYTKESIDRLNINRSRIEKICGLENSKVYDYILEPTN